MTLVMYKWGSIVIDENMRGLANDQLKKSYVLGMLWFIFSEVMFFAAFFGALFYVRVFVNSWLGGEAAVGWFDDTHQPMPQRLTKKSFGMVMRLSGR